MGEAASLRRGVERLEAALERLERVIEDLTAELRTPLLRRRDGVLREGIERLAEIRPALLAVQRGLLSLQGRDAKGRVVQGGAVPARLSDAASARLQALGVALRRWKGVMALLARAAEDRVVPLYATPAPDDPRLAEAEAFDTAFDMLESAFAGADQDPEAQRHGCYSDIRLPPSRFLAHAHAAWRILAASGRLEGARFLDVGCGSGSKVLLASRLFAAADGLEFDPGYVAAARRILGTIHAPRTGIIQGDALTFEAYDRYEVIYFYRPMSDPAKLARLEERIAGSARPGTVFITPYQDFPLRAPSLGAVPLGIMISVAGLGPEEAGALRRAAERTGPDLPDPARLRLRPEDGLWAPLLCALRRNGFAT
ncbi:MAG TPA: hypothetical protein VFR34_12845 [Paracoccaceae bacterium]|nr:hypothetical protein [Paracoccaceae bacterium]